VGLRYRLRPRPRRELEGGVPAARADRAKAVRDAEGKASQDKGVAARAEEAQGKSQTAAVERLDPHPHRAQRLAGHLTPDRGRRQVVRPFSSVPDFKMPHPQCKTIRR
jgi:hypothetical protein